MNISVKEAFPCCLKLYRRDEVMKYGYVLAMALLAGCVTAQPKKETRAWYPLKPIPQMTRVEYQDKLTVDRDFCAGQALTNYSNSGGQTTVIIPPSAPRSSGQFANFNRSFGGQGTPVHRTQNPAAEDAAWTSFFGCMGKHNWIFREPRASDLVPKG